MMLPIDSQIPDAREREEALTPNRSFIVQAPAGSGKTGLLVQRILRLLSVVERPESVVAMTFTIKAAAEMKERLLRALEQAADGPPTGDGYDSLLRNLASQVLAQDRRRGWNLLRNPGRLQIQTIDAFCAMLVRHMPLISDSGGVGQVIEDPEELYRLASRRMLQNLAGDDEAGRDLLGRVALYFDNDIARLERQIALMLGKRDQWYFDNFDNVDALIADFRCLLEAAETELRQIFRERNVVDFSEVTRAAIKALGGPENPSDLLYSLDYRIEHFLVDEFQDTSRTQYELLSLLTGQWSDGDGRTLFLVGDPMQSIYRFRAAEVALFLRAWRDGQLGSVRLRPLRLQTNFRSTPEIANWTQDILGPVVGDTDIAKGAVKLERSEAARSAGNPVPEMIPFLDDGSGKAEAKEIVRLIRKHSPGGDVAILVRSRSHITSILPALRDAEIPYQAVEIDRLNEQPHILDLLALTRAICHLADRISWLSCLRAPWCGLTLADLSALVEGESDRAIVELLSDRDAIARLTPDGRFRAVRLGEILSAAINRVGRVRLRELVEKTWFALGGPAIMAKPNQLADAETFFELLESFEDISVIQDFSLLSDRLESLYAKPDTDETCVRVMTVHEAKGLEFDTVILPQLGKAPRGDDDELLVWNEIEEDGGRARLEVAAQPQRSDRNSEYARIKDELKEKTRNEAKRLFYVACTRARNRLYLLGSVNRNKQRTDVCNAASHTFLGMIWPRYKPDFQALLRRSAPTQASLFENGSGPQLTIRRLARTWPVPTVSASVRWEPQLSRESASTQKITYEWVSSVGRHVGTVVHEVLHRIAKGHTRLTPENLGQLGSLAESELARLGVARKDQSQGAAQVIRALESVLTSGRGQWILKPYAEARSEWQIQGVVRDRLISGTVDRLFRDEDGRLWIVDFKTSEHRGGNLNHFIQAEERRYRPQMENYGTLVSRIFDGPVWLGLYFPLLNAWREWPFEAETALTAR